MVIDIPYSGPSPNVKMHWSKRHLINQNIKILVRSIAKPRMMQRARIIYTRYGRMMDEDNLAASAKPFIDALKGWVIPDDNPNVVEIQFRQKKGKNRTVIEVEEIPEN
jgi:Holliday junction resolvase RusA-like endonuclease